MPEKPEVGPHDPLFRWVILPLAKLICWIVLTVCGPFRCRNRRNVPRQGGLLVLANHQSDIDPVAVQLSCPRPIHFMAKSELFEMKVLGDVLRRFDAFPVKRGEPDRASIKKAVALLRAGEVVCVFPEGQLSETGALQELKAGIVLLVRMGEVPAICLGLNGTNRIMPYAKTKPRFAFHLVTATWGKAKTFGKDGTTEEIMAWADAELKSLMGQAES